jgi:carbon-monoxide dehydrogenase medium subunit
VKPPRFSYHDPDTLDEALSLLAEHGDDAKILAGGQSLMPMLNFRLARPKHVVDINRIRALDGIDASPTRVRLGALVRQRRVERSASIGERCPLLSAAVAHVGHPQIRNRGTVGGSLAHADPAAELPGVMLALDARFTLRRAKGERVVAAADFFQMAMTTVLEPDEMLTAIDIPVMPARTGVGFQEFARRRGDFALAGVAATLTLGADGTVSDARIACIGVEDRPVAVTAPAQMLKGSQPSARTFAEARRIVAERVSPRDDIHATATYRRHLAGVLTERALAAALRALEARPA